MYICKCDENEIANMFIPELLYYRKITVRREYRNQLSKSQNILMVYGSHYYAINLYLFLKVEFLCVCLKFWGSYLEDKEMLH